MPSEKSRKGLLKIGYYLSIAFYDLYFRIFFIVLSLKSTLFTYLIGLPINSFFPLLGFISIALSLSLIINNKFRFFYLFSVNLIFSLLFFINSLYFKYFGDFASFFNLPEAHQLGTVLDVVFKLIRIEIFYIFDLIFLPLQFTKLKSISYDYSLRLRSTLVFFIFGVYCSVNPMVLNLELQKRFLKTIYYRYYYVSHVGIINYQIVDAYYYVTSKIKKQKITQSEIDYVKYYYYERKKARSKNSLTGSGKLLNLIMIQVESLQNFVIFKKINGKEVTSNLNKLARGGIYFRNIYDQTASGNTSDATFLSNASLFPISKGVVSFLYPDNCFDSLPKILKSKGYTTAIMHALDKTYWNMNRFGKALGFEKQFYADNYEMTEKLGGFSFLIGLSDREFFKQSIKKIRDLKTPFYALLITLSSHVPFAHITREMVDFPLEQLEGEIIGYYLRAINYTDSAIGEFIKGLSENNLLSNTIIVVFGDHRARLPERELRRIGIDDMSELKKVPLIISIPGKKIGLSKDTVGGLIDVAPTVLSILGIDFSDSFFMGRDLLNSDKGFAIFRDGSFISNDNFMNDKLAKEHLIVSDLIIQKDMIPLIRGGRCE